MNYSHVCTYQYYDPRMRAFIHTWKDSPILEFQRAAVYDKKDVQEFDEFADFLFQLDFLRCFSLHELNSQHIDEALETFVKVLMPQPGQKEVEGEGEGEGEGEEEKEKEKEEEEDVQFRAWLQTLSPTGAEISPKTALLLLFSYDHLFILWQVVSVWMQRRQGETQKTVRGMGLLALLQQEVERYDAFQLQLQPPRETDQVGANTESSA